MVKTISIMLKFRFLLIALVLGLFSSCESDSIDINNFDSAIIGSWINPSYIDSTIILEKSSDLKDNEYGIKFMDNGTLIERKNSGFCGTPPIYYTDYNGTWSIKDSLIQVSVDFWGGKENYKLRLVSVDNNKLKIIKRYEDLIYTEN